MDWIRRLERHIRVPRPELERAAWPFQTEDERLPARLFFSRGDRVVDRRFNALGAAIDINDAGAGARSQKSGAYLELPGAIAGGGPVAGPVSRPKIAGLAGAPAPVGDRHGLGGRAAQNGDGRQEEPTAQEAFHHGRSFT